MKMSSIKKLASCTFLTLLFSLSLGVVGANAEIPNTCDGNGILKTGEKCDNDDIAGGGAPLYASPDGNNSNLCTSWGYLDSAAADVVVCLPITCNVDTSGCFGKRTTIEGAWSDSIAPDNVPSDIKAALMNVTNWILGFIAIIATLVIIYGGVLYLTAAGNEDAVATAKKTISYGIIGIVIAGLAYAMVVVVSAVILG